MGIFDVSKAEKQFKELVGKTEAEELLKRVGKAESQNLNAQGILNKVDEKLKGKYTQISKKVGKLLFGKNGIIYLLSTKPHTTSGSNFVKLVTNKVLKDNEVAFQMFLENPGSLNVSLKINNIRDSLMRYLKLTKNKNDDSVPADELDEDLKEKFTRNKKANIGEKMNSFRKVNRLKVIVVALIINLIDNAEKLSNTAPGEWRKNAEDARKKAKEEAERKAKEEAERKAKEEEKRKAEEEKNKNQSKDKDPGIFRGLPNGNYYCYLNTALQNLYTTKSFSDKVLKAAIPDVEEGKQDNYKELRATQFFFKYLHSDIDKATFSKKISGKEMRQLKALDLGYVEHQMGNSVEIQANIERVCRNQMRVLNKKSPRELSYRVEELENPSKGTTSDEDIKQNFKKLYDDEVLRNRVLGVDDEQLIPADLAGQTLFGFIRIWFNNINAGNKDQTVDVEGIKKIRDNVGRKDFEYEYIKRNLEQKLNALERQKRAYLLMRDSKVSLDQLRNNVKDSVGAKLQESNAEVFYLPLKNNQFVIELSDRNGAQVYRADEFKKEKTIEDLDEETKKLKEKFTGSNRNGFSVEEDLDLSEFVNDKKLKVFIKNKELAADKCKFNLVSATIGTGGHYYLYKKIGTQWKEFNDNSVTDCDWKNIQSDINGRCELLTYELKS